MTRSPGKANAARLCRAAFVLYTLTLVTATHWPSIDLGGAPSGSDKVLHIGAYLVWGALATASGLFGHWWRMATACRVLVVGMAFAALDEVTQGLPGINRHPSVGDWVADVLGLGLGAGGVWVAGRSRQNRSPEGQTGHATGDPPESGPFS